MTSKEALRAALYARVSSEQQAKENTVASQVDALQQRIKTDRLTCDDELRFIDDGYSGGTLVRPALERLRDLAAAGGLDCVYVHSPDRLARKYAYQVLLVDELRQCGVELIFLNRQIGTSPEEDLLLQVQGMVAEYERAKILERSRRGKRHAARRGAVNVLSGAPYGYRYMSKHEGDGEAKYQIVFEEACVVQRIFAWVGVDRLSIGEACRRLKAEGISSPRGKNYWDRTTVWGILKNPAYKGLAAFGKTRIGQMRPRLRPQRGQVEHPRRAYSTYNMPREDWIHIPVPAIVSEELFDAVAEQLVENRARSRQRKRGARHLLQGLLTCRRCGYAFYGKPVSLSAGKGKRRDYAYYRCIGMDAYRFGGHRICDNKQVRTDLLEASVWEDVCSLLGEPERIQREYQRRLAQKKKSGRSPTADSLTASIQRVKRGIARLIDAYEDGLVERGEFAPRVKRAKDRLAKLESQAEAQAQRETEEQQLRLVIGQLEEFAERVKDGLDKADWATRREIIRALVKRVEVDEGSVRIVYRVGPPRSTDGPAGAIMQHCRRGDHPTLGCTALRWEQSIFRKATSFQGAFDQSQHPAVRHLAVYQCHELGMIHGPKEVLQIRIDQPLITCLQLTPDLPKGIFGRSSSPVSEVGIIELRFKDRFQPVDQCLLAHTIENRWNAKRSTLTRLTWLGNHHLPYRLWLISIGSQFVVQTFDVDIQVRPKPCQRLTIDTTSPAVGFDTLPRQSQVLLLVDLVHQRVDLLRSRRVDPVGQSPRTVTYGSFTYGTYPRHDPYSSRFPFRSDTFASRLPQATRLSLTHRATDHMTFTTLEVLFGCPTTRGASLLTSHNAYRVAYPTPLGTTASPPGVTHESSTPCHPQTPWYERWIRTPSPP